MHALEIKCIPNLLNQMAGHLQQEMEQMGMVLAFAYQKGLEIKAISPADFGDSWSPADVAGHATYMVSLHHRCNSLQV